MNSKRSNIESEENTNISQASKKSKPDKMEEAPPGDAGPGKDPPEVITLEEAHIEKNNIDTKWQLSKKEVKERIAYLRKTGDFSDCSVLVGEGETAETIKLHRIVLCMSSPRFAILFSTVKEDPVRITDVEPRIFNILIDYMYLDHVELKNAEDARYLYKASVSYAIPHLCEISAGYMAKDLNFDNIWQVLELVAEIQEPFLKEECGKFVRRNPQLVLSHVNFSKLSKGVVANIVELDCLDVPEIEIILAVDRWAESQCTQFDMNVNRVNKREFIGPDILEKLRFLAVPQDAFVKELAFTPDNEKCLLTLEESYAILMNLTQVGSFPIPTDFSSDKRARKLAKFRCIRKIQQLPPHMMGGYTHSSQMYAASYASAMERVVALASPTQSATLGGKNFSLDVKVDHPIILYGIQVPTLCFPVGIGPKNLTKEYDESFVVTVQDPAGTPINQTVLSTKVPYGSSVDIILKDSVVLQRNVTYKIQVYTSNNYFLSKKLSLMEENPPVKFSFRDAAKVGNIPPPPSSSMYATGGTGLKQETDLGFITQVIYSLWI